MIRILLADDHALVREGIRHVLEADPALSVLAEAATAAEAVALAAEHRPDVVVLDVSMRGESGIHAAAQIRRAVPGARLLMLSMHDNPEYVAESVRAGADGYVLKDAAATELRDAVRLVHGGRQWFSAAVAPAARAPDGADALATLTGREREVLVGVATGRTNKEIAAELGISRRTVESHRESVMRKLGIRTVAGLTALALERGLVSR